MINKTVTIINFGSKIVNQRWYTPQQEMSTATQVDFNFYYLLAQTLRESIQDIKNARESARKKYPHMFSR